MTKIASDITALVGGTTLLELANFGRLLGAGAKIIAKLESFNPGGSVKYRIALAMLDEA